MLAIHNGISKSYQLVLFACLSTFKEKIYSQILYQQIDCISLLQKHQSWKEKFMKIEKIVGPNW